MASSSFHLYQGTLSSAFILSDNSYFGIRGQLFSPSTTQHHLHHNPVGYSSKHLWDSPQTYQGYYRHPSNPSLTLPFAVMPVKIWKWQAIISDYCWLVMANLFLSPLFGPTHLYSLALPISCELLGEETALLLQICTLPNPAGPQFTTLRCCRYNY